MSSIPITRSILHCLALPCVVVAIRTRVRKFRRSQSGQLRTFSVRKCSPESCQSRPTTQARGRASQPKVAGLTPTAGALVFTGDLEGNLLAFDAASGKVLLKTPTGGPVGGGITTYSVKGKQYEAVAAGMKNAIMKTESGPATMVIDTLPSSESAGKRASLTR